VSPTVEVCSVCGSEIKDEKFECLVCGTVYCPECAPEILKRTGTCPDCEEDEGMEWYYDEDEEE
jgi:predicted amidophosphoribosyltransferase